MGDPLPVDEPVSELSVLDANLTAYASLTGDDGKLMTAANTFNSIFSEPADFQAKALENGLARIHDALDRAT